MSIAPPPMAAKKRSGGIPSPSASASVSAPPSTTASTHEFATSFRRWPAPASPASIVRWPTASKTGAQRSIASRAPEARTTRLPCSAGAFVPSTGASRYATRPCSAARRAQRSAASIPIVLICAQIVPSPAAAAGRARAATCSTAAASASIVTTTSRPATASSRRSCTATPSPRSGAAFSWERFQAAVSSPAFARLRAIGAPMMPVPRTATERLMPAELSPPGRALRGVEPLTPLRQLAAEVDRAHVVLGRQLVEHLADDVLHVALLVAEAVEHRLERRVRDLQLGRCEVEPEGRFTGHVGHRLILLAGETYVRAGRLYMLRRVITVCMATHEPREDLLAAQV